MTKKRSKCLFVLFAIILVVCLIACFVNFTYPLSIGGNYYSYSNFISNVKTGEDVGDSLRIVYEAKPFKNELESNYNNLRTQTISDLQKIVQSEGYADVSVVPYGDYGIAMQIGNLLTEDDNAKIESLIGKIRPISFSTNADGSDPFTKYENIKSVTTREMQDQGVMKYYVLIEFDDEYKSELAEISKDNTIYVYLGEDEFISGGLSKGAITEDGYVYLSHDSFKSILDVNTIANQIKSGMLPLDLQQQSIEPVTASYGVGADLFLTIALCLLVLAGFVFMIVKYKHMGWISCFAMMFFVVISLFLIQSIPTTHMNFAGFIAFGLCVLVMFDTLINILETAKKHYQEDTKLYIAFKMAMKECLGKTFMNNLVVMLAGFVCMFMPVMALSSFGWIAFVMPIIAVFVSLVLMRLFINMYLALNNTKGEKCNFHKGGKNA